MLEEKEKQMRQDLRNKFRNTFINKGVLLPGRKQEDNQDAKK